MQRESDESNTQRDKYDDAIAYLRQHPQQIKAAWGGAYVHPAGCLFQLTTPDRDDDPEWTKQTCGCLTQIRQTWSYEDDDPNKYVAWTPELTAAIAADERIPKRPEDVTVEGLPVFAEWQRKLDVELQRGGGVGPCQPRSKFRVRASTETG